MSNPLPGLTITREQFAAIHRRVQEKQREVLQQDQSWFEEYMPLVLPAGWQVHQRDVQFGIAATHYVGLKVIMTGQIEDDHRRWVHLSCSRDRRLPNWDDLKLVKELFLGPDRWAVQVLPKQAEYVNINPFVLHLWHCVDDFALPDFTQGTGSI